MRSIHSLPPCRPGFANIRPAHAAAGSGWPAIQRGENTLILAPTGSGKTLAAFLWGIDQIYRELAAGTAPKGVRLLYVSPLKALNNDIHATSRAAGGHPPHGQGDGAGVAAAAAAVRTGDTPAAPRRHGQAAAAHPDHYARIALPYVDATAPARSFARSRTVIVDEIHTVCGNKRGVHLALTLERLQHPGRPADPAHRSVRHAASARRGGPLLGGYDWTPAAAGVAPESNRGIRRSTDPAPTKRTLRPKSPIQTLQPLPSSLAPSPSSTPATDKPLDLQVITAVEDFRELARQFDLAGHYPARGGDDQRAQDDADLHQQPPPGRAHRRPAQCPATAEEKGRSSRAAARRSPRAAWRRTWDSSAAARRRADPRPPRQHVAPDAPCSWRAT